jgi:hypothetical protein
MGFSLAEARTLHADAMIIDSAWTPCRSAIDVTLLLAPLAPSKAYPFSDRRTPDQIRDAAEGYLESTVKRDPRFSRTRFVRTSRRGEATVRFHVEDDALTADELNAAIGRACEALRLNARVTRVTAGLPRVS